ECARWRRGRALLGPDQVADQASGLYGWEVKGFLVAQQCPCQAQQPPVPSWRYLALLAPEQECQGQVAEEALVSGVSERLHLRRRAVTSRHLPELLPLLLGSGKVGKKDDSQRGRGGQRWTEEATGGGTDAGSPWGPVGARGLNGGRRNPSFGRRGAPGRGGAGVSLPGLCRSILQRGGGEVAATLPGGRPC
ncbi:unnamed protein product, partial [Gulo gulo]